MSVYTSAVLADSPIAFWELQDTSGTTAVETVGGLNGTYSGSFALAATGPLTSGDDALDVHAGSGWVDVPNAGVNLAGATAFTQEFIVKPSGTIPSFRYLMGLYDGANAGYAIQTGSSGFKVIIGTGTAALPYDYTYTWPAGYHHIAVVWDSLGGGGALRHTIYIDGVNFQGPINTGTVGAVGTNTSSHLRLMDYSGGSLEFPGFGAYFALYNYALTSTQVATHFAAITAGGASGSANFGFAAKAVGGGSASANFGFSSSASGLGSGTASANFGFHSSASGISGSSAAATVVQNPTPIANTGNGSYTFSAAGAGNTLLLSINSDAIVSPPTGWDVLGRSTSGNDALVLGRKAVGGETSVPIQIANQLTTFDAMLVEYSGVNYPPEVAVVVPGSPAPVTSAGPSTSATLTQTDLVVGIVLGHALVGNTPTSPGWTNGIVQYQAHGTGGTGASDTYTIWGHGLSIPAGPFTTTATWTNSSNQDHPLFVLGFQVTAASPITASANFGFASLAVGVSTSFGQATANFGFTAKATGLQTGVAISIEHGYVLQQENGLPLMKEP